MLSHAPSCPAQVMALLVAMNVRGGIMIAILLSTFFCWILEAGEVNQVRCYRRSILGPPAHGPPLPRP